MLHLANRTGFERKTGFLSDFQVVCRIGFHNAYFMIW